MHRIRNRRSHISLSQSVCHGSSVSPEVIAFLLQSKSLKQVIASLDMFHPSLSHHLLDFFFRWFTLRHVMLLLKDILHLIGVRDCPQALHGHETISKAFGSAFIDVEQGKSDICRPCIQCSRTGTFGIACILEISNCFLEIGYRCIQISQCLFHFGSLIHDFPFYTKQASMLLVPAASNVDSSPLT